MVPQASFINCHVFPFFAKKKFVHKCIKVKAQVASVSTHLLVRNMFRTLILHRGYGQIHATAPLPLTERARDHSARWMSTIASLCW